MNKLDVASEQFQLVNQKEEIIQDQKVLLNKRDEETKKQERAISEM